MRRYRLTYWIVLAALALAATGKTLVDREGTGPLMVVAILTAAGAVLGWATFAIAGSRMRQPFKGMLVVLVGYHALFGPVMLAYVASVDASRNDDLALRLYPHVIAWINSLE